MPSNGCDTVLCAQLDYAALREVRGGRTFVRDMNYRVLFVMARRCIGTGGEARSAPPGYLGWGLQQVRTPFRRMTPLEISVSGSLSGRRVTMITVPIARAPVLDASSEIQSGKYSSSFWASSISVGVLALAHDEHTFAETNHRHRYPAWPARAPKSKY